MGPRAVNSTVHANAKRLEKYAVFDARHELNFKLHRVAQCNLHCSASKLDSYIDVGATRNQTSARDPLSSSQMMRPGDEIQIICALSDG